MKIEVLISLNMMSVVMLDFLLQYLYLITEGVRFSIADFDLLIPKKRFRTLHRLDRS
jgi:hypothetical protein